VTGAAAFFAMAGLLLRVAGPQAAASSRLVGSTKGARGLSSSARGQVENLDPQRPGRAKNTRESGLIRFVAGLPMLLALKTRRFPQSACGNPYCERGFATTLTKVCHSFKSHRTRGSLC
jgi:hypothetical protein